MANEMTIKQGFTQALNDYRTLGNTQMVAFFEKRLAQLEKKSTAERKRTPRQIENDAYKEIIVTRMNSGEEYTIDDMLMYFGLPLDMKTQRVSALLAQLIDDGSVMRCPNTKGKCKYKLAE